jgi:hypothetical protein
MGNTSPTPVPPPRKRIDKALLQALMATMPFDAEGAAKLVRWSIETRQQHYRTGRRFIMSIRVASPMRQTRILCTCTAGTPGCGSSHQV